MRNLLSESALGLIKLPEPYMRTKQNKNMFTFFTQNCNRWEAPALGVAMAMKERWRVKHFELTLLPQVPPRPFSFSAFAPALAPTHWGGVFTRCHNVCTTLRPKIAFSWTNYSPPILQLQAKSERKPPACLPTNLFVPRKTGKFIGKVIWSKRSLYGCRKKSRQV